MRHYGIKQSQHCNNDNKDNGMHASVWFEFFDGLLNVKAHDIWEGNVTTRREMWTEHIRSLEFRDVREGEEFPCKCRQEDRPVKQAWERRGPAKWRCDLARGALRRLGCTHNISIESQPSDELRSGSNHKINYLATKHRAFLEPTPSTQGIHPPKWEVLLTFKNNMPSYEFRLTIPINKFPT